MGKILKTTLALSIVSGTAVVGVGIMAFGFKKALKLMEEAYR